MSYFKATIELLLWVDDEPAACDAIAETLRPHLQVYAPESCIIDWRYAGPEGNPDEHDGYGFEYAAKEAPFEEALS